MNAVHKAASGAAQTLRAALASRADRCGALIENSASYLNVRVAYSRRCFTCEFIMIVFVLFMVIMTIFNSSLCTLASKKKG